MKLFKKIYIIALMMLSLIAISSCEVADQPKNVDLYRVVYTRGEEAVEIKNFSLNDILIYTTIDGIEAVYPANQDNITYSDYQLLKTEGSHTIKVIYGNEVHEVTINLKNSTSSVDPVDPVDPDTPDTPVDPDKPDNPVTELTFTSTDIPEGYYTSTYNLSGETLKKELRSIISVVTSKVTYGDLREDLAATDAGSKSNTIRLFYSGKEVSSAWDGGTTWNREHVWPTSKGWWSKPNNSSSSAGTDIHHIRPADSSTNSSRGNQPFGESSSYYKCPDAFKGDVARIYMYMLVRYAEADSVSITNVIESLEILLKWNEIDPVDEYEIARNNAAYKIQGNRNPFIDCPDYAKLIWGTTK